MTKLWKTMLDGMRSQSGDLEPWTVGEWRVHDGPLEMCHSGFHASQSVIDAIGYVNPGVICEVEVRGDHLEQSDKECWSEMRVLRAWTWTKEDSVALAIYAAELVLHIYEERYPDDTRPRQAIEAAKAWLKDPNDKSADAAWAAWSAARAAADAARAADAAWSAARAAADAAWAAWSAARAAADADAAWAAARAAADADAAWAAWSAARAADVMTKCHAFVVARLEARGAK